MDYVALKYHPVFCLRNSKDWVTWPTFIIGTNRSSAYAIWLALEFLNSNVRSTIGPGKFLGTKVVRLKSYLWISLCSNSHGPSMYASMIYDCVCSVSALPVDPGAGDGRTDSHSPFICLMQVHIFFFLYFAFKIFFLQF